MKIYIKIIICCLLFYWQIGNIAAQPVNKLAKDVVMPAPNAAALGKYSDIPVSYSTGVPNISIPIYTLQDGSVSLPISLNYHASGIKVGEPASWVGQGWSLNAGGIITRSVMGLSDEGLTGYLTTAKDLGGFEGKPLLRKQAGLGKYDTEPDIFSFNIGGYSGKFYFGADDILGDKIIPIVTIPMQDVKISLINETSLSLDIQGFIITDPQGVKYTFGSGDGRNGVEYTGGYDFPPYASSWYLLKIESADKKSVINLFYDDEEYSYHSVASCAFRVESSTSTCQSGPILSSSSSGPQCSRLSIQTPVKGKRLKEIRTGKDAINLTTPAATSWVKFKATTPREDLDRYNVATTLPLPNRLDVIEITTGTNCKKFQFAYDYFEDDDSKSLNQSHAKRLQLKTLQETECTNTTNPIQIPAHTFSYFEGRKIANGRIFLPNRLSKAIDHWGFYNGASNNESGLINVPYTVVPVGTAVRTFGNANRNSDPTTMKYGVLNKITYPTGGATSFEYERNDAYVEYDIASTNIQEIFSLTNCNSYPFSTTCCSPTSPRTTTNKQITFDNGTRFAEVIYELELLDIQQAFGTTRCIANSNKMFVEVQVLRNNVPIGTRISIGANFPKSNEKISGKLTELIPSPEFGANYTFILIVENGKGNFSLRAPQVVQGSQNLMVGGLRIKSIKTDVTPEGGSGQTITKNYSYTTADGTRSSGVLYQKPKYGFRIDPSTLYLGDGVTYNAQVLIRFEANSIVPLGDFNGYHIIYSRVTEELNGNGKNVYTFNTVTAKPINDNTYPFVPVPPILDNGQMLTQISFKNIGAGQEAVVSSKTYTPDYYKSINTKNIGYKVYYNTIGTQTDSTGASCFYTIVNKFQLETGIYRPKITVETTDGVITTTTTTYDQTYQHFFPTSTTVTNSDNKTYTTETTYSVENTDAVATEMKKRNIITPIQTIQKTNGTQTGGTRTNYGFFDTNGNFTTASGTGTHPYPRTFENYKMTYLGTSPTNGTWETDGTVNKIDPNTGNPTEFTLANWDKEYYTWNIKNKLIQQKRFNNFTWNYEYYDNTRLVKTITDIDGQFATRSLYEFLFKKIKKGNARRRSSDRADY